ncbi:Cof-type HAD-IIB family hydrolase [Leptolyngbya sp. AN02str]|uniref:Cof-type HAD-IIB family hydrolase n=1 Tax=Leptolyngbya sp. AN02str TaxID=3423363 RepID=UPI003D31BDE1
MADIQLLVVDLDGTVVGRSNQIEPIVIQAIRAAQQRGIRVAIATGRMFRSALRFHHDLTSDLPLMVYQGALIKDPATAHVHRHWAVSKDYVRQLLDFFEQPEHRDQLSVHLYIEDELYVRELTEETARYAERSHVEPTPVGDLRNMLSVDPTKVLVQSQNVDLINQLLAALRQRYRPTELYLTKSVDIFLEAANPLVNKGAAVQYLAEEILGLQPAQVMAIGDNFNDLEMIQYAGIGVAMGNAPDGVKAIANWIAPEVEVGGAAAAIEEFLLK